MNFEEQDVLSTRLSNKLGILKNKALLMNNELDDQNVLIDMLDSNVDYANAHTELTTKKVNTIHKMETKNKFFCVILILIIILVILIILCFV
jgi:t-SNARE complex subunit (syntaxin)